MRPFSLVPVSILVLILAACGSSTSEDSGGGEITSREDVQSLFEAIMPELVDAFTELANQQFVFSEKGGGGGTSVPCPEGGSLNVDTFTGQATLVSCGASGVVINGPLALFVQPLGPNMYRADFNGTLTITGTFSGVVQVNQAFVQWSDPPSVDNIYWEATVTVLGQTFFVSSGSISGGICDELFGNALGYQFCADTGPGCKFFAVLNESSCTALCASFSTSCMGSISDLNDGCAEGEIGNCTDTVGDRICICAKP